MSSTLIINISRFMILLLLQVVVFSKLDLFGFLNPYPYILFILLYPVNSNRAGLLLASFCMGLMLDMFLNSGGSHAVACVVLAYLRPSFFRFSFGISYEYQTVRINDRLSPERFSFMLVCVVTHHFILYLLEIFRFSLILDILIRTILSAVFTLILCITIIYLIKPGKQ
ncbi:rod shape-determining protein MreD [Flavobacterium cyanobacteriorum]|uniref:Rod shape-determining protein MreD n=1 Tax=Flavobacterium cyanobacteriorum TaxID=2022802 RepID=A0A255Z895_9FLAO|nr:rod shape-determining protein MreD [Flavobacterium cyanobacteriorum]OYQ37777.1 rod shape-determining protein MreD [Flavobacterium cyanobacteriorum]